MHSKIYRRVFNKYWGTGSKNKQDGNRDLSERSVLIFRGMVRLLFQPPGFNISYGIADYVTRDRGLILSGVNRLLGESAVKQQIAENTCEKRTYDDTEFRMTEKRSALLAHRTE